MPRAEAAGVAGSLIQTPREDKIRDYFDRAWYPESFYLLAMLDYISRVNVEGDVRNVF